jgi:hypothetical protein
MTAKAKADRRLRELEDERDQVISALSGTPNRVTAIGGDRSTLRARLDELNHKITAMTADRSNVEPPSSTSEH